MAVTTRARPAGKPAGRKPVRASKSSKAKKPAKKVVLAQPKAAKPKTAKPDPLKSKTPATSDQVKPCAKSSRAVSVITAGRYVPAKIMNENSGAPLGTLLARVSGAIEDELTQIEMIVSGGAKLRERNQAERRARTLASLARTLREVMQLRAGEEKARRDDDAVPRDIGELRAELARRLDRIVASAKAAHPDTAE